jgi:hypothetical protein
MLKQDWENIGNSMIYAKKSDSDPPFWIESQFYTYLTKFVLDKLLKHKLIAKNKTLKYWKMPKLGSFEFWPPAWTSDAILNLKSFSSMKYVWLKYKFN